MAIKSFRPLTPSAPVHHPEHAAEGISKNRPERSLGRDASSKTGGRNVYGRVTSRRRGGGHKQLYRIIDFKRSDMLDMPAKVQAIEYDPNRTAHPRAAGLRRRRRSATSSLPRA